MFKLSEIKELIKLVDQSSLQELEIENEGARLSIRKPNKTESVLCNRPCSTHICTDRSTQVCSRQQLPLMKLALANGHAKQEDSSLHKIVSPMVGTFYQIRFSWISVLS